MIDLDILYTIAKPVLAPAHARRIESWRAEHDAAGHALLGAHFTLIFACSTVERHAYAEHVRSVAAQQAGIRFVCRRAVVLEDASMHYVVLEPLKGRSRLIELHQRLHTGLLMGHARADVAFVPHITIGKIASAVAARQLCARLNDEGICVAGEVANLTVGSLHDSKFCEVASFALERQGGDDVEISRSDN